MVRTWVPNKYELHLKPELYQLKIKKKIKLISYYFFLPMLQNFDFRN